jgi:hypothetical protein
MRCGTTLLPLSLLLLLLAACGPSPDKEPDLAGSSAADRVAVPGDDLGILEELAHVGYVDRGAPDGSVDSGVVLLDPARVSPGYSLVTSIPDSRATLVDLEGKVLRVWTDPELEDTRWSRAELLANGDVLCLSPKEDFLERQSWDGRVLWRLPLNVHHDATELPDGRLLVLTRRFRVIPEIDPARQCVDNLLTVVSSDGRVLEELSLYDVLQASPGILPVRAPRGIEDLPAEYNIDPMHANTVQWLSDPALVTVNPLLAPGNVLVTIRYLDSVALIDWKARRALWAWGAGELEGPHDASVLPDGHILLLDNGYEPRGFSRVVELDPLQGRIVWEYRAPEPRDFYSSGRGTVQGLPNGNVLVGNSNSGEAFEITRAGEVVWRYLNPHVDADGARGVIRIERYDPGRIERYLRR